MEVDSSHECNTNGKAAAILHNMDNNVDASYSDISRMTKSVECVSLVTDDLSNENKYVDAPEKESFEECVSNISANEKENVKSGPYLSKNGKLLLRQTMLDRIANSEAHFKHQQRGEPDLTYEDKLSIATNLLEKNQVIFLSRFGRYLIEEDLQFFSDIADQYEVSFYLSDIQRFLSDKKNEMKKRNPRFEAMKKMMNEDDYFSAESMKERDPLLYEQLVGQYMTDEESAELAQKSDLSISAVLMQHVQSMANSELYNKLCDIEDSQMEEGDDSADEEELDQDDEGDDAGSSIGTGSKTDISPLEKQMLKNEFLRTMQLRFLNGDDRNFNYKDVDENVDYDSLDIREQDEEEKYFDLSDSESMQSHDMKSHGTNSSCDIQPQKKQTTSTKDTDDDDLDYDQYVVTEDICPGLNHEKENSGDNNKNSCTYETDSENESTGDNSFENKRTDKNKTLNNDTEDSEQFKSHKWGEYGSDLKNNG